ncbi:uncharacterized protein TNCV_870831 [Trichonephila clavipes]|nr:uncharacterized protein TNCV_870831 [Trichonephila clavipes]
MNVFKCIVPSWHGSTLNSHRAANPFVRLVEGIQRLEAPDHPRGVLPQNWGGNQLNRSAICMVLKATANGGHHLGLRRDEFRGQIIYPNGGKFLQDRKSLMVNYFR